MVAPPAFEPMVVPAQIWERADVRELLRGRDVGGVFRVLRQHGLSQGRLAATLGMSQGRVSEIARGARSVTTLEVFERIADGLGMPDDARIALGLAPSRPVGLDHLGPAGTAEVAAVYPDQSVAFTDITAAAETAHTVEVLAVRGLGILGLRDSLLRSGITSGSPKVVRALLLDPESDGAVRRAREIGETPATFRASAVLAVSRLREMAAELGHLDSRDGEPPAVSVECYLYSSLPTWRVIALGEVLFVSAFTDDAEGHRSPMYKITHTSSGGALYRGFRRHIDEVRRTARRVV